MAGDEQSVSTVREKLGMQNQAWIRERRRHELRNEKDWYDPEYRACELNGEQIRLSIRADEVGHQGWDMPELFGMSEENREGRS